MRAKLALGVALILATAACGTTLSRQARSTGQGLGGGQPSGSGLTGTAGAASPGGSATGTDLAAVTGASARRDGGLSRQGADAGSGGFSGDAGLPGAAFSGGGANGPGITATTITVGISYATNDAAYEAALGNTAVSSGNTQADAQIVVKDINAHGGILGRKLIPVYHPLDATDPSTSAQKSQAACADFTQDHHVFAAVPGLDRDFDSCLQKAGALIGTAQTPGGSNADYNAYPAAYDILGPSTERVSTNLVSTLVAENYFTSWDSTNGGPGNLPVKVGVIIPDRPEFRRAVPGALLPALAAHGIKVDPHDTYYYYSWPQDNADDGATVADIQNAELRFRSDNVTHVLALEVNGQVFFGRDAESQHYRPRYGVNSWSTIQAYSGNLLPTAQLNGAVGLGFLPLIDLPGKLNPDNGPYSNDRRRYCAKIMQEGGQTFSDGNAEGVALAYCDLLYTLRDILGHVPAGQPLNQATAETAINHTGYVQSGNLPEAFFGPGHHAAVTAGWRWEYFADCQCMYYTGPMFPLS